MYPGFREDLTEEERKQYRAFYNVETDEYQHGEAGGDGATSPSVSHECPMCSYAEYINTPYTTVYYWCRGRCDKIRHFRRIEDDE